MTEPFSGLRIDPQTIVRYREDGAVHVPGLFADWVAPLSEGVLSVIGRERRREAQQHLAGFEHQNDLLVIEEFGGGAMALNVVGHHAVFTDWLAHSPAAEAAATMMTSEQVRFWVDASFYKDSADPAEGTPWHNDTCTWPFWGRQMTILWIALTDVGPDDGPLTTVRGSHRGDGRYYSPFFPPTDAPPAPYKPWDELLAQTYGPGAQVQTWTMRAGDCLFLHPSTIHGSRPRLATSRMRRLSFSTRWLGDDVVWNPDPLTERMTTRLIDHPAMQRGAPPPPSVIPVSWPRD